MTKQEILKEKVDSMVLRFEAYKDLYSLEGEKLIGSRYLTRSAQELDDAIDDYVRFLNEMEKDL